MSWGDLSPDIRDVIERVCTDKELDAVKMKAAGYGRRRIAVVLGISDGAVRDRIRSAERKIIAALERLDEGIPG